MIKLEIKHYIINHSGELRDNSNRMIHESLNKTKKTTYHNITKIYI